MVLEKISSVVKGFASKVLAIDDTSLPREQIKFLKEFGASYKFALNTENIAEMFEVLRQKHLVDSIIVTERDGSIIATTEQNGLQAAITGTALFNYVNSELARTETVLIKCSGEWFMVFCFSEKIFVVKAAASLSNIELKALAKEINLFLSRQC